MNLSHNERMKTVCLPLLALVTLGLFLRVGTAAVCSRGHGSCHAPSLADLLERVIQQSSRIHAISSDLHSEVFDRAKNRIGKQKCHTSGILTPNDKGNAQRLDREELAEVVLRLLGAWEEPLSWLHRRTPQDHRNQGYLLRGSTGAKQMGIMVQELRDGVAKVTERMKLMGAISNDLRHITSHDNIIATSSASSSKQEERNSIDPYDLLYCFQRDTNKVQNYLRILKCTILPELEC